MATPVVLNEGIDYSVSFDRMVRVTAAGLYRIMETHASGAEVLIRIDGAAVVEFEAAAGAVND